MLGEHFIGHEGTVLIQAPMCDHSGSFTKQVRQYLVVMHRDAVPEIGHHEAHIERAGCTHDATLLDHATEPKALPGTHLASGDRGRIEVEHHVLLECAQRQQTRETDSGQDREHPIQTSPPRRHDEAASLSAARRRRASRCAWRSERRAQKMFRPTTVAVNP